MDKVTLLLSELRIGNHNLNGRFIIPKTSGNLRICDD